jgi:uncharacterized membrane protein
MHWQWMVLIAVLAASFEKIFNRLFLADGDAHWEYLVGYNIGALLLLFGITSSIQTSDLSGSMPLLILSGVLWFLACYLSFRADQLVEVGLTSFLTQIHIVLVFIGGWLLLGEGLTIEKASGALLIVMGLMGRGIWNIGSKRGAIYKLLSVGFMSAALLADKVLSNRVDTALIAIFGFGVPLLLAVLIAPKKVQRAFDFSKKLYFGNVAMGALGCVSYYFLIKAMITAPVSVVVGLFQTKLLVTIVLAHLILGENEKFFSRSVAAAIVVLGAVVMQW